MATTDKGAICVINLFAGTGAINAFNVTNSRIGVGDSSTAFSASQTDLQAVTNKFRKIVDSAPVVTTNSADYTATYALAEANFAWNEIALFNSLSGDYMATRRTLSGFGTKTSSEAWTVTLTVVATAA
jgi:hypothetical protein